MTARYDELNARVRGIIDRTIAELMTIGMEHQEVMKLLVIQAIVRMDVDDAEALRELRAFIDRNIVDDDGARFVRN